MNPTHLIPAVLITMIATLAMDTWIEGRVAEELATCQQQVSTLTNNMKALVYGAPKHPTTRGE